jgi:MFS family permease
MSHKEHKAPVHPLHKLLLHSHHTAFAPKLLTHPYPGNGTPSSPYLIAFLPSDPSNPLLIPTLSKWTTAIFQSLSTFAVTFASSIYASALPSIETHFSVSPTLATLGLSLYVFGFALGPLIWAPLSEVYGRRIIFVVSYTAFVAFSIGAVFAPSIAALLVLRFLASAFGASTMANTGGIIADMFEKKERGLATGLFATTPFLGPALGT